MSNREGDRESGIASQANRQRDNKLNAFELHPIVVLVLVLLGIETYFSRQTNTDRHTCMAHMACYKCNNNANDVDDYDNICTLSVHIFTAREREKERDRDVGS